MYHTITVASASNSYARLAEAWALKLSALLSARLRAVVAWDRTEVEKMRASDKSLDPEQLTEQITRDVVDSARSAGIEAESVFRGEGALKGILAEAQETDLLVIGLPTEERAHDDSVARAILDADLPILRRAECSVLVAAREPADIRSVLVSYQGGHAGKSALRAAGTIAEASGAAVNVISGHGDRAQAEVMTGRALRYLEGFDLPRAHGIAFSGQPEEAQRLLQAVEETKANLIVLGHEPYGVIHHLFADDAAEAIAVSTDIPVLIAR